MKNFGQLLFVILMIIIANNVNAQSVDLWGAPTPTVNLVSNDANDTICAGASVTFTTPWEGATTYQYTVNGSSMQGPGVGNNYTPSPAFIAGNQEVIVIADNGTCQARDTIDFVTLSLPVAGLTVTDNSVCLGTNVVFTGTGAGAGGTYTFLLNGGNVQSSTSPTYTTSTLANGDIVSLTVTNAGGCSSNAIPITMTIYALPTATLTVPDNSVCENTSVTFTAGGGVNNLFRVNGTMVYNGPLNTYTSSSFVNGDVVTVEVTNVNGCTSTSAPVTMTIFPTPHATSVVGNTPGTAVCPGSMTSVTITGLTGTGPWDLEFWNAVGGVPTTIYYDAGSTTTSTITINVPVINTGQNQLFLYVIDANNCDNN